MRLIIFLMLLVTFVLPEKLSYENYQVFKVKLKSRDEYQFINEMVASNKNYNFWTVRVNFNKDPSIGIMVAPGHQDELTKQLKASNMEYELTIENVKSLIDRGMAKDENEQDFSSKYYHSLDEIYNWLDNLSKKYPSQVKIIIGGRTYENREIKGVKISFKENNPGIFIEGGIHAEEWIAPATVMYLINEFLTSTDLKVRQLAESHDWYIFPTFNPDGYVYTYTTDRLWRKSMARENNSNCIGIDLNRNWDYKWMAKSLNLIQETVLKSESRSKSRVLKISKANCEKIQKKVIRNAKPLPVIQSEYKIVTKIGASSDSCSNKYAGRSAFSEVETQTMSEYIKSIGNKLFAYISFHSFAQLLMIPYGDTAEHKDNYNETHIIGLKAAGALATRYGTKYEVGSIAEIFTQVTGTSTDWVKATLKLPIVYVYELRDEGYYGTVLPPEQIIPTGEEILDSLIAMFEEAKKFGYLKLQ